MGLRNTHSHYGSIARGFHWTIAIGVALVLLIGMCRHLVPHEQKATWMTLHKSLGLTLMLIMILRLIWRWIDPAPKLPHTVPSWQRNMAGLIHGLLYLLIIAMPLTGWIMSTAAGHLPNIWWLGRVALPGIPASKPLASLFSDIHTALAWLLGTLIALHVAAALKHHLIDRNGVLQRMWR